MTRDVITNCKSSNRLGVIRRGVDLIREENLEIHTDNFDITRGGGSIGFQVSKLTFQCPGIEFIKSRNSVWLMCVHKTKRNGNNRLVKSPTLKWMPGK